MENFRWIDLAENGTSLQYTAFFVRHVPIAILQGISMMSYGIKLISYFSILCHT